MTGSARKRLRTMNFGKFVTGFVGLLISLQVVVVVLVGK